MSLIPMFCGSCGSRLSIEEGDGNKAACEVCGTVQGRFVRMHIPGYDSGPPPTPLESLKSIHQHLTEIEGDITDLTVMGYVDEDGELKKRLDHAMALKHYIKLMIEE